MKEPIIIPKKGAVNLLYLAGALVFTGLCLVFSFSSFSYLPSGHQTLMAILKPILFFGIFFFGLCSYYYAKRIFQDRPLLLVDETGVTDHSTAFAVGHIPGAKLLPLGQVLSRAAEVLPDKNAVWLVYCRTGRRSADAVRKLESLGYTRLYDLGGILSWPYEIEGDFEGHF